MNLYLSVAIVLGAMAVGAVLMVWVGRRSPEGSLSDRTPTNVYAVTGGAMSLLIAFTFSAAFGVYTSAQNALRTEAAQVLAMYRATNFMEDPLRGSLRNDVRCYAQLVTTLEWPQLGEGNTSLQGPIEDTIVSMDYSSSSPQGIAQAGAALSSFEGAENAMLAARVQRISAAEWGVPPIVYFMIILGSIITIGSLFVFADRSKPAWGHGLVIVGPVFVAVAGLLVISFFDNPFVNTPGGLTPQPMIEVTQYIDADMARQGLTHSPNCDKPLLDLTTPTPAAS